MEKQEEQNTIYDFRCCKLKKKAYIKVTTAFFFLYAPISSLTKIILLLGNFPSSRLKTAYDCPRLNNSTKNKKKRREQEIYSLFFRFTSYGSLNTFSHRRSGGETEKALTIIDKCFYFTFFATTTNLPFS